MHRDVSINAIPQQYFRIERFIKPDPLPNFRKSSFLAGCRETHRFDRTTTEAVTAR